MKCHLLVCGYKHENVWAQIGDKIIWENNNQRFLGLQIDRNLDFNMSLLSKNVDKKLCLCKIIKFPLWNKKVLMKSFIEPQVGYCPLIWMFHGRWMNNKISYFHKHSLRLAYIKITIGISKTNLIRITWLLLIMEIFSYLA